MKVYVAGPITKGDQFQNVARALLVGQQLLDEGHAPFIPHLTCFWHFQFPNPYETWMKYDDEWLKCCDAFVRIPGESSGADREHARAMELDIPTYDGIEEFLNATSPR